MSVKKNYLYNVVFQVLNILIPLITAPYISRVLGAEGIGIVTYTHSVALYFGMFGMLGLANYGSKIIAANKFDIEKRSELFSSIYLLQIITTTMMTIAYIFFVEYVIEIDKFFAYIQLIYLVSTILDINWFFFGMEEFKVTVSRNIIIKIVALIMMFIFVNTKEDLWIYALITTMSTLVSQVVLWSFLKGRVSFKKTKIENIMAHLKPNLVLFIPVITISIYKVMDKIMLGALSDMFQIGLYENSMKIINIPMGVITALGTVMLPRMSILYAKGEIEKSKVYIRKSMQFSMFLAIPMFLGLAGIADNFAPIFFGEEFIDAGPLISYLAVTVIFISWANVIRTQYLLPNNKEKIYIIGVIIGAIANMIINLTLIPLYGATGAAIGTIIAEVVVTVTQSIMVKKELEFKRYIVDTIPCCISGVSMLLVIRSIDLILGKGIATLIGQVILGGVVYIVLNIVFAMRIKKLKLKEIIKHINKED